MFNFQVSRSALISNRPLYISLDRAYNDPMPFWIVHKDLASGSYNWEYYSPNVVRLNEVSYKKYSDLKLPLGHLSGKIISQLSTFWLDIIVFFLL